jgi:hypothetical protein
MTTLLEFEDPPDEDFFEPIACAVGPAAESAQAMLKTIIRMPDFMRFFLRSRIELGFLEFTFFRYSRNVNLFQR